MAPCRTTTGRAHWSPLCGFIRPVLALVLLLCLALAAHAQISFTSAVDLALNDSPRVRMAQDDVVKARAALAETHDAYLPTVEGVMDLGYSYGAPIGEPTLFSFDAHSLAFSYSQKDYMRAAHSGLAAASLALSEARQEVAEDAAITYLSLDCAQQRRSALAQQYGYATRLVSIVQQRVDAGQDTAMELTRARQTAAQIHLQMLLLDDEIDGYHSHLARLDGLPDGAMLTLSESIPPLPAAATFEPELIAPELSAPPPPTSVSSSAVSIPDSPGVAAAFANARAKQQQAFGDSRYLYRPQVSFFAQYSRFSTFNNYQLYYPAFSSNTLNAIGIGIQISVPFYDRTHQDKVLESSADAAHAQQEAIYARDQFLEGRAKLQHANAELAARTDLADLDQQLAQQQLDAILVQLQAGTGDRTGPQLSPKDEQNARIAERQKFLDLLDARFKLRETQIQLLRQNGDLDVWIKSASSARHPGPSPSSSLRQSLPAAPTAQP
jgi:outer membrane protein TolC